jgi:glycosyltransferase involved in cell wall biosynthesis
LAPIISVITCSHNSRADYLDSVFSALRNQTLSKWEWEYILVDNASSSQLANRVDLSWHPLSKVVREDHLGLTSARLRGIAETHGDMLVFVDDDNVLDQDYLENARHIFCEYLMIGAFSGQCRPGFEKPPPDWSKPYWGGLVIREFDKDRWSNLPELEATMPCGAGLCVRRQVAEHYCHIHEMGMRPMFMDRIGSSLVSGGDNDLAACACDIGQGIGLFSSLKLTHLIPPERLEEDYLVRLAESVAYSGIIVQSFHSSVLPGPPSLKRQIADVLRFLLMDRRAKRFFLANRRGAARGRKAVLGLTARSQTATGLVSRRKPDRAVTPRLSFRIQSQHFGVEG